MVNLELLTWLVPLFPVLAFAVIVLFTNRWKRLSHTVAIGFLLISFVLGMIVVFSAFRIGGEELAQHPIVSAVDWMPTGESFLRFGVLVDPLTAVTLFFVLMTLVAIFVYSVGYMRGDPRYSRFFALISLFATGMLGLVVSDNLLMLFIFWEIMGFCSYALIGFWFEKPSAHRAGVKAFITTRVGDVLMLLGIAYLYALTGTLNFREILNDPAVLKRLVEMSSPIAGLSAAALVGLLLFGGTVGKSAQFPLHVWLPDAMEGPTPVSALIHAATMVSAGVYLVIRTFPLLSAGLEHGGGATPAMWAMGLIGAFTAFLAATMAVAQFDIKRVLAYSTISQLGYMIAALGVGAYVAAAFHLITHAFFKALLFLGSGSVIHAMEHGHHHAMEHAGHGHGEHEEPFDPNDMRNMGGLREKMPITFWTFTIGGLALAGFPLVTAGFWSKDEILAEAFHAAFEKGEPLGLFVYLLLALAALLTAFYTMRQITMTFLGEPRTEAARHAPESDWTMTVPLIFLSIFAVGAGFVGVPADFPILGPLLGGNPLHEFVGATLMTHLETLPLNWLPVLISVLFALGGLWLGYRAYEGKLRSPETPDPLSNLPLGLFTHMHRRWYFDELYDVLFVRPAKGIAFFIARIVDRGIIDGILHFTARTSLILAEATRVFDRVVPNGIPIAVAEGIKGFGRSFRTIQTGQVQNYLLLALVNALVLAVVYLVLFQ